MGHIAHLRKRCKYCLYKRYGILLWHFWLSHWLTLCTNWLCSNHSASCEQDRRLAFSIANGISPKDSSQARLRNEKLFFFLIIILISSFLISCLTKLWQGSGNFCLRASWEGLVTMRIFVELWIWRHHHKFRCRNIGSCTMCISPIGFKSVIQ